MTTVQVVHDLLERPRHSIQGTIHEDDRIFLKFSEVVLRDDLVLQPRRVHRLVGGGGGQQEAAVAAACNR